MWCHRYYALIVHEMLSTNSHLAVCIGAGIINQYCDIFIKIRVV